MKKILLVAISLMIGISLWSQALELHRLYDTYRGEEDVISLYIPGFICRLAGNIADLDYEEQKLLRSIKSVRVQVIENREINREVNFARAYADIRPAKGYFPLLEVHDGDEDVLIFARQKKETICELIILVGGNENVMVWVKGRMDHDLMKSLYEVTGIEQCRYTRERKNKLSGPAC